MPDSMDSAKQRPTWAQRFKQLLVPTTTLLLAGGIVLLIVGNWNTWASERGREGVQRGSGRSNSLACYAARRPRPTSNASRASTSRKNAREPEHQGDRVVIRSIYGIMNAPL
jgi:hypothetical protein